MTIIKYSNVTQIKQPTGATLRTILIAVFYKRTNTRTLNITSDSLNISLMCLHSEIKQNT